MYSKAVLTQSNSSSSGSLFVFLQFHSSLSCRVDRVSKQQNFHCSAVILNDNHHECVNDNSDEERRRRPTDDDDDGTSAFSFFVCSYGVLSGFRLPTQMLKLCMRCKHNIIIYLFYDFFCVVSTFTLTVAPSSKRIWTQHMHVDTYNS